MRLIWKNRAKSLAEPGHRLAGVFSLAVITSVAWAFFGGPVVAAPQQTAPVSLNLSSDIEGPGYEVTITVNLRLSGEVEVGKAVSEISYPGKTLEFVEAVRGLSAEAVGAEVTAVTEDQDGETTKLTVSVTAKEGESLPQGVLANLYLKISEEAPANEIPIPLINRVSAWSDEIPRTQIESVTGEDGQVTISANPPVFAC
ncbi:MAG: hypothetical protein V3R94_03045, partial [Acidobacteriota bacterium]